MEKAGETLIKGLRGRIASLLRARKLAYRYDMSRFLRAVRLALHPAQPFNQCFPGRKIDLEVDARGLKCPVPILRAKKALAAMESGQVLRVLATDPGAVKDFQLFAQQTGNELLEQSKNEDEYFIYLKRK